MGRASREGCWALVTGEFPESQSSLRAARQANWEGMACPEWSLLEGELMSFLVKLQKKKIICLNRKTQPFYFLFPLGLQQQEERSLAKRSPHSDSRREVSDQGSPHFHSGPIDWAPDSYLALTWLWTVC